MFAPSIAGVLVVALAVAGPASAAPPVAPEARADALEAEGSLADAAAIWASIFHGHAEQGKRLVAAFRAQKAWRAGARASGDPTILCEAQALVAEVLRLELDAEDRGDFEVFAAGIRRELVDVGHACAGDGASTPAAELIAPTSTGATILSSWPPPAPQPQRPVIHADPPRSSSSARPMLIIGGVTLGAGAVLLGAMTVGLVQNYRAGQTIDAYAPKNNSVGLSPAEIAEVEAAQQRVDPSRNLALGAGITGGALLVAGASLIAVGRELRRSGARTAIVPAISPSLAGVFVRGRF